MKRILSALGLMIASFGFVLTACSPSPTQLKKVVEAHPEIVFSAIKADPKGFFDTVQGVQEQARLASISAEMDKEFDKVKTELASPQTVDIAADRAFVGSAGAPVTIVEWADFNCGHCQAVQDAIQKIVKEYGDKVRVVYKHLPILAPDSKVAAQYMEAIALQNKAKAVQFHDLLFANQNDFRVGGEKYLKTAVKSVGADLAKVERDAKGATVKKRIADDMAQAKKFGFDGTPGFMVNGAAIDGAYPYDFFKRVVDYILQSHPSGAAAASPSPSGSGSTN